MKVKVLKAFKDRSQDGVQKMYMPGDVVTGSVAEYALAQGCGEEYVGDPSTLVPGFDVSFVELKTKKR